MMRCFVCLAALAVASVTPAAEPQRWALLVGVNDYVDFADLSFAGNDAADLANALRQSGFDDRHIALVTDDAKDVRFRPIKANIERQLTNLLGLAGPGDLVIISFCGHGIHIDGKSYLCPSEANDARPAETMIAVDDVYKKFGECKAALKLLVVDACRNDPRPPGKRSASPIADLRSLGATFERPPEGIVVLASCAPGQISWEDKDLKHGVFMHHLLKGLSGDADGNRNGRVTLGELYDYASMETKLYVFNRFNDVQVPAQRGEINGVFELPGALAKEFTNSIGMKLTLIPAGEFMMGSPNSDIDAGDDEKPQHRVRITKPFYMGTHEVTRGQFAQFVAAENHRTEAERDGEGGWGYDEATNKFDNSNPLYSWRNTGFVQSDDHPVVNVTSDDAQKFCHWLSRKEGNRYHLPTEAQWEYACRAGTTTKYYHGDNSEDLTTIGNVADRSLTIKGPDNFWGIQSLDGYVFTSPVGRFKPNNFGLYDMTGNVWEWCDDWYGLNYYATSPIDDPSGISTSTHQVLRGSSWLGSVTRCRSAFRLYSPPTYRSGSSGFRIVSTR